MVGVAPAADGDGVMCGKLGVKVTACAAPPPPTLLPRSRACPPPLSNPGVGARPRRDTLSAMCRWAQWLMAVMA